MELDRPHTQKSKHLHYKTCNNMEPAKQEEARET